MCPFDNYYVIKFNIGPVTRRHSPKPTPKRATLMLLLTDEQQVVFRASAVDARGNPATLDANASPTWNVADNTLLTLTPVADDPMSAVGVAVGPLGVTQVSFTATVNGNQVAGMIDTQIIASDAVNISISADTPTDVTAS
jgi:hypothetical protein